MGRGAAKKVNEAYTTLKDRFQAFEYDRKHSEAKVNRRNPSHAHTSHTSGARREKPSRAFAHSTRSSYSEPSAWDRFRTYLPKAMIGIYALAAGIFLMYIYEQNRCRLTRNRASRTCTQAGAAGSAGTGTGFCTPARVCTERADGKTGRGRAEGRKDRRAFSTDCGRTLPRSLHRETGLRQKQQQDRRCREPGAARCSACPQAGKQVSLSPPSSLHPRQKTSRSRNLPLS